jgi:hypothetical protein
MELYLSYDDADQVHGERLKRDLLSVAHEYGYTVWSKQDVIPGGRWQPLMAEHLRGACLFIPLVSSDFLASDRCHVETTGALQLAHGGSLRIVPVILRPCMWEYSALTGLPALPANRREVTAWNKQDQAWVSVQGDILKIVRSFLVA